MRTKKNKLNVNFEGINQSIPDSNLKFYETDVWLLSYLVKVLLPDSRRGKYTSFEDIMNSNGIVNAKVPSCKVEKMLFEDTLFWIQRIDWKKPNDKLPVKYEYCINPNNFFTIEERSQPNFRIDSLISL